MIIMLTIVMVLLSCVSAHQLKYCRTKSNCNETQFCITTNESSEGSCGNFNECNSYNRQQIEGKQTWDVLKCGECLPGYEAEKQPSETYAVFCKKITNNVTAVLVSAKDAGSSKNISDSNVKSATNGRTDWIDIGRRTVVGFLVVFCFIGVLLWYRKKFTRILNCVRRCVPMRCERRADSSDESENPQRYSQPKNNIGINRDLRGTTGHNSQSYDQSRL